MHNIIIYVILQLIQLQRVTKAWVGVVVKALRY
jgi:hypothetical protein